MEIVNGEQELREIIHNYLEESFKDEPGKISYSVTLINSTHLCRNHGIEITPCYRVAIFFNTQDETEAVFRADDIFDVVLAHQQIVEWLDDIVDSYRIGSLELSLLHSDQTHDYYDQEDTDN